MNGAKEEVWKRVRSLTQDDREWVLDKVLETYCINCACILGPDGECTEGCADDDDEDDEEDDLDSELDPDEEEDEEEEADDPSDEGEATT